MSKKTGLNRNTGICAHWDEHEDRHLQLLILQHGRKWKLIAKRMQEYIATLYVSADTRSWTSASVRNRFLRMNKDQFGVAKSTFQCKKNKPAKNKCTICGELKRGHTCTQKYTIYEQNRGEKDRNDATHAMLIMQASLS